MVSNPIRAAADGTVGWGEVYDEARQRLAHAGFAATAAIDARRIVEAASGCDPDEYVTVLDAPVTLRQMAAFDRMVARRLTGEPLQYVVGSWSFRHLDLLIDRRVLIPRPETEVVAECALAEYDRVRAGRAGRGTVADLGTGSGALALSFAFERESADVYATDVDPAAIEVARANLSGLGRRARAVRLREGSWFDALPAELRGALDVIVSNPPYIGAGEPLDPAVRDWEPERALIAGPTGLEALQTIVAGAPEWLQPHGALVVEVGDTQSAAVAALAQHAGFADAVVARDLAGRDRVVIARR